MSTHVHSPPNSASQDADAEFLRFLDDLAHEFHRHRRLVDKALGEIDDATFFHPPGPGVNPIAVIVKHLAGSMRSRWTDFGRSDGEKPDRDRDGEFAITASDTRAAPLERWAAAWTALDGTLATLRADPSRWRVATATIRGEAHSVTQALLRGAGHVAYHTGQILYLVRWMKPDASWQTIAPGASGAARGAYRAGG